MIRRTKARACGSAACALPPKDARVFLSPNTSGTLQLLQLGNAAGLRMLHDLRIG